MLTEKQIVSAILEGTCNANDKYKEWSGGWQLLDSGVESLIVSEISDALIRRSKKETLLLEVPFNWIKGWTGAQRKGRIPKAISGGKKADIALSNSKGQPVCIIEVKRQWNKKECMKDLDRIWASIDNFGFKNKGTLRRGFFSVLVWGKAQGELAQDKAEQNCEKKMDKYTYMIKKEYENGKVNVKSEHCQISSFKKDSSVTAWGVLCIQISLKNK